MRLTLIRVARAGAFAAVITIATAAAAQDTHYWNLQYGTRGELLGGVVVGSAVDLSATYYNPGSLALVQDPSVILTASVFAMQTLRLKDVDPDQQALASRNIGPAPSMFAGLLPMKWFGGRMAYSFLMRQQFQFRLTAREGIIIGRDAPGDTLSIGGEAIFDQDLGENWAGLTWSKRVREGLGVGATFYGVYRSQRTRLQQNVVGIGGNGYGASLLDINEVDYYHARALAKIGVEGDFGATSLGVSLTTPSLGVMGTGTVLSNRTVVGDVDLNGTPDSEASVGSGKDLDTDYRSPFSAALGASYTWSEFTLHATAEYFAAVDEYTIVSAPAPKTGPGVTGNAISYRQAVDSVVNFGAGLEKRFSERGTAYVSFITDRSTYRPVSGTNIVYARWDIYHVNGGVALTIKGTDLTLGGGYAWGGKPLDVSADSAGTLPPTVVPSEVSYTRIKLIVGFAL